ncbi:MAG: WD40/YVTN/BNR-like repeat-containing protein [Patescibacteria group bacterium]
MYSRSLTPTNASWLIGASVFVLILYACASEPGGFEPEGAASMCPVIEHCVTPHEYVYCIGVSQASQKCASDEECKMTGKVAGCVKKIQDAGLPDAEDPQDAGVKIDAQADTAATPPDQDAGTGENADAGCTCGPQNCPANGDVKCLGNQPMLCGALAGDCNDCASAWQIVDPECTAGTVCEASGQSYECMPEPPHCDATNCPNGCCEGTVCVTAVGLDQCGTSGHVCLACNAELADTCAGGACKCGNGPACTNPETCAAGICRPPFTILSAPTSDDLYTVWGSGPDNVFISGEYGKIFRYNGAAWSQVYAGGNYYVAAIHGSGAGNIWAACSDNKLLHSTDGQTWTGQEPCADDYHPDFSDIRVFSSNEVIAVYEGEGKACHQKNGNWQTKNMGSWASSGTWKVWGASYSSVWTVDNNDIGRWNGYSWQLSFQAKGKAVWGSADNDAWMMVSGGHPLHYDGNNWTEVQTDATGSAVWGSGPNDVYALPYSGGIVWHYDGAVWSKISLPSGTGLRAGWSSGPNDVYIVGNNGTILHWSP